MLSLAATILKVESTWLTPLYHFCKQQFSTVEIPSHDDLHHLRVWQLAKQLINELAQQGHEFSYAELELLIIAIFFHDTGLIETIDQKHGLAGRLICQKFFDENYPNFSGELDLALDAIEKHDDKAYKNTVYHGSNHKTILSILCVCDDLDAFGAIGVFRYMEIYMLRGVAINDLANMILPNLESRYKNFHQLYGHLTHFHEKQTQRYQFIRDFYLKLQQNNSETKAILKVLIDGILKGNETINTIATFSLKQPQSPYLVYFFDKFTEELQNS